MKYLTLAAALVAIATTPAVAQEGDYGTPGYTGGGPSKTTTTTTTTTTRAPERPQTPQTIVAPASSVQVIDGDTIELAGRRVRLAAIDAPERDQLCDDEKGTAWRCGAYAAAVLAVNFAKAKPWMVTCTLEPMPDRYGRAVGVCTFPGSAGDGPVDIASVQVLLGFAVPYYKYGGRRYEAEYINAKDARRGMHAGYFEPPAAYRQRRAGR